MIKTLRAQTLVLMLAACVLAGWPAFAQGVRVDPKPLDATDPQAKRAGALVKQILAGDKAAALKTLRAEGDEKLVKNPDLEKMVDAQIARLGKAKYTISAYETGLGADVVVLLEAKGGDETNIVIRYNDAKKIVGFAQAQIDRG